MQYFKLIIPFAIIVFWSCKEMYNPDIQAKQKSYVIQAIVTDQPGDAIVRVFNTAPFDSLEDRYPVKKLEVTIHDTKGNLYPMYDNDDGSYSNYDLVAQPGVEYYLTVESKDGNIYQSEIETLSPHYKQDSIYIAIDEKTELVESSGSFTTNKKTVIETFTDLSSGGADLPKCRYDTKVTILAFYTDYNFTPPATIYTWKTVNPDKFISLTAARFDKVLGKINKHSITYFSKNVYDYYEGTGMQVQSFLVHFRRFNLSDHTYQYYSDMMAQLKASGKIFDPQPSQLLGNIKCVNNADKSVFGNFEVSSVEDRYYMYFNEQGWRLIEKSGFEGFTPEGESIDKPAFWDK